MPMAPMLIVAVRSSTDIDQRDGEASSERWQSGLECAVSTGSVVPRPLRKLINMHSTF